jgi:hypothetical protein
MCQKHNPSAACDEDGCSNSDRDALPTDGRHGEPPETSAKVPRTCRRVEGLSEVSTVSKPSQVSVLQLSTPPDIARRFAKP